ncbi:hypothetical protein [Actinokineospora sp.]|uniref:hypothetical protein n=1 Tax=Actinokineospora sp. TaxID=1872133 RepID=UPI003D6C4165
MTPEELAEALRRGPFHLALRSAIAHRGLSLARLRSHLARLEIQVAESTLSYWQRGLRHPDTQHALPAVRGLETVLGLPADSLVVLVDPRQRGGRPRRAATSFSELVFSGPVTRALFTQIGADADAANADIELMFVHERITIAKDRSQGRIQTRVVGRTRRAGVDRYVAVYNGEPGVDIAEVRVSADEGCRLGRVRRLDTWVVFELMFDRRLIENETIVLAYTVDDESGIECPGYSRLFRVPCGPFLLQIELPPDNLPARITQVVRGNDTLPPSACDELFCDRDRMVNAFFPSVEPGIAGIALDWD